MSYRILRHPILDTPETTQISFTWKNNALKAKKGETIAAALYANGITIFGHHHKDGSAQGIFCANGQCSRCMVIADSMPVKACMIEIKEGMVIEGAEGIPVLPEFRIENRELGIGKCELRIENCEVCLQEKPTNAVIASVAKPSGTPVIASEAKQSSGEDGMILNSQFSILNSNDYEVIIIGGGPSGLSAAIELDKNNIKTLLVDDKNELGGKLVLQTHKFFGSVEDSFAGTRGIDIGRKLSDAVFSCKNVEVWLDSTVLYIYKDKKVGIYKNGEYVLVTPKIILNAAGAREKFLRFSGNSLPGVYGAGAFQTLVNRDLIKSSNRLFIIGGGNVGLIAGYHALQAGIEVVGLVEAMPKCGGYKVHADKLKRLGVPIYTSHTIVSANGNDTVESVTIAQIDKDFKLVPGTEKSFSCDTVLIAVGLESLSEFTEEAETAGIKVYATGDALEIAEASSAMFNGKIVGAGIASNWEFRIENLEMGIDNSVSHSVIASEAKQSSGEDGKIPNSQFSILNLKEEWEQKAAILKSHPGKIFGYNHTKSKQGIYPVIHCLQEIPCNPCTSVCPNDSIVIKDNTIMGQPVFEGDCVGCMKCLLICPGLAISMVDFRKDAQNPTVILPYEVCNHEVKEGDNVEVVDIDGHILGKYTVTGVVYNKNYKTQQIKVQMPVEPAKKAISIKIQADKISAPLPKPIIPKNPDDDTMLCLCERVKLGDVRDLIQKGITDINQIKAITRLGMGACGSKTCDVMIRQVFRQCGVAPEKVVANTRRPLFVETTFFKFGIRNCELGIENQVPPPVIASGAKQSSSTVIASIAKQSSGEDGTILNSQFSIPNSHTHEVIVIGAGSIGVPTALSLAKSGKKVLCIDSFASPGQGNHKRAIGGVRATHSDFGKISVCQRSIEIFSTWKETHGDDIGWMSNGYSFVAYDDGIEQSLKELLKIQQSFGLNISWLSPQEYSRLAPGIVSAGLRGATYSPEDGSCSPLLAINAMYFKSLEYGAEYRFGETVASIEYINNRYMIKTDKGIYSADYIVNAAGNFAKEITNMLGLDCPVTPDSHEAAITDPVQRFFEPMIIDLRSSTGSKNYYFYQNNEGQVVFCITPDPLRYGTDNDATSEFLPLCVSRILQIFPKLGGLKVRRQWRGQYPMTPDGFPIVGAYREHPRFIQAVGMCGQGFMLGPGIGELIERIISGKTTPSDEKVLQNFDPYRQFSGMEKFK